ncbi:glycosyltransferase [Hasllibacter sp. MH4015]|uniref:glycosyltransferase n=1 Tax=Hasllibacter sp. MH4015 TaxID=2854029 RepID=UPI001CD7292A|nr:glycosyltransferase [Hasllibacter sp. MH4015]
MRDVVIYVGAFELPERNAAAQRVRANATLLASLGYKVVLAGRDPDAPFGQGAYRPADFDGIDHDCWQIGAAFSRSEWMRYITRVDGLAALIEDQYPGRVHSIICYNFPAMAQMRVRKLARKIGARAMADVTEWYQPQRLRSVTSVIKNLDTAFRMRVVNPRMDALITTSAFLTRYYSKWFDTLVELPTLIEHDPSDISGLSATPDGAPKRLFYGGSIGDRRTIAAETGGMKDRIDWVLDILAAVRRAGHDFRFDLYGVTRDDYLAVKPEHADMLEDLASCVTFHGRRPRAELLEALKTSDYSIFLRKPMIATRAGFPTKFAESISVGTPVLTNPLENIAPFMTLGPYCESIEYDDFETAVARVIEALTAPQDEVLRRKHACRQSALFHPLSFRDEASALFPKRDRSEGP